MASARLVYNNARCTAMIHHKNCTPALVPLLSSKVAERLHSSTRFTEVEFSTAQTSIAPWFSLTTSLLVTMKTSTSAWTQSQCGNV